MNNVRKFAVCILLCGCAATSHADAIDPFVGSYVGETRDVRGGSEVKRDLSVDVSKTGDGFRVQWKTTKFSPSGKAKTKSYDIEFVPSERRNVYSSAMKTNVFGGRVPLDPMKGDPYVWARIDGRVLIVHALLITERGDFEVLTYRRRLVEDGLVLEFDRMGHGSERRRIEARLERVDG